MGKHALVLMKFAGLRRCIPSRAVVAALPLFPKSSTCRFNSTLFPLHHRLPLHIFPISANGHILSRLDEESYAVHNPNWLKVHSRRLRRTLPKDIHTSARASYNEPHAQESPGINNTSKSCVKVTSFLGQQTPHCSLSSSQISS